MYIGERRGGVVLMHVYVWEKMSAFSTEPIDGYLRNLVGMKCSSFLTSDVVFFGQIRPGADPGWGKNRSMGCPSLKNFFFRLEGYSNKSNAYQ